MMSEPTAVEPTGKLPENSELNPSQGAEQPLEAEIVEPDPGDSCQSVPPEDGQVSSLVYQPQSYEEKAPDCLVQWAILDDSRETSPESERAWVKFQSWLDNLLTPWGISSLLLLLVANILLTYTQLSNSRNLTVDSSPPESPTDFLPPTPEIPPSPLSNLAANPPETFHLNFLSTLPPPSPPSVRANRSPAVKVAPANPVPSNSLSNALLPPSLQPQLVPPHAQPYPQSLMPPSPVTQPPVVPSRFLPPPPPLQSLSVPPSIPPQSVPAELPPPPPASQAEPSEEQAVPPVAEGQIPARTDSKDLPPLGNVQKYRLKVQGIQNQINPQPAMQEIQRLQQRQLQQQ